MQLTVKQKNSAVMLFLASALLILLAFSTINEHCTVYLAGDSTMAIKQLKAYPETGWGMPFANYFDSAVVVDNRAKNGRSTKTFITEGLWKALLENLRAGDYVFIQFGHNDEVKTKTSYTTEEEFKTNLLRFISDARKRQAIPVLLTPVTRRQFDNDGHIRETHPIYSGIVRTVAAESNVPLIDLDELSRAFFEKKGAENSKLFFNYLEAGENPNYAAVHTDDTHFNELGARCMAEIVLRGIADLKLPLAAHIVKPAK